MRHPQRSIRSRTGSTIFGDLTWIITFVVCAMILFFWLYKPLVDDIKDKADRGIGGFSEEQLPVYSDAQYVALGLRETRLEAGNDGAPRATVSRLVTALIEERHKEDSDTAFVAALDASGYDETLEKLFTKGSPFWTGSIYRLANGDRVTERQAIAIIINDGGAWLGSTCREYTQRGLTKSGSLCSRFDASSITNPLTRNSNMGWSQTGLTRKDPDTGVLLPAYTTDVETGSVYIPTTTGPATIYVFIERGRT